VAVGAAAGDVAAGPSSSSSSSSSFAASLARLPAASARVLGVAPAKARAPRGDEPVLRVFCAGYSTFVAVGAAAAPAAQRLFACGLNSYGQLGLGHTANVSEPAEVAALAGLGVAAVSGGNQHTLALTAAGAVYAFGRGCSGQLGLGLGLGAGGGGASAGAGAGAAAGAAAGAGDERHGSIPVGASAFSPCQIDPARFGGGAVVMVSANGSSSAALSAAGGLYTWGFGESGQLGNRGAGDENVPFLVNRAAAASAGAAGAGAGAGAGGNELRGLVALAVGMGGQHAVALAAPAPGGALPGGARADAPECAVVEDPPKDADDDADDGGEVGGEGEAEEEGGGDGADKDEGEDDEGGGDDDDDGEDGDGEAKAAPSAAKRGRKA